jgi:Rha family phage regulatory protein
MMITKEKPFDAGKQTEGQFNEAYTPMQKQNNTVPVKIKKNNGFERLIISTGNILTTDSLIVAEKFKKQHKHILEKIENLIKIDDDTRLNFRLSEYKDSTGRSLKKYIMNRRSFSILCMSFNGKKALKWKNDFYDAFEKMERVLLNRQNLSWQQARIEGKQSRIKLTDAIKRLVELATSNGSKNAEKYFISITNMIYKQVFNLKKVPDQFRDTLDKNEIYQLQLVEWKIAEWLNESIDNCLDYHNPYTEIKSKLKNLVAVIGVINLNRQIAV